MAINFVAGTFSGRLETKNFRRRYTCVLPRDGFDWPAASVRLGETRARVCTDFLSAVSNEFGDYRDQLRSKLTRHNVEVKIQEDFKDLGGTKRLAEAEPLMRRALAIFARSLGSNHPRSITVQENLNVLLRAMGRSDAATSAAVEALIRAHGLMQP
jgi:Tetratricopeptide repeat